jgi:hypothetical protein
MGKESGYLGCCGSTLRARLLSAGKPDSGAVTSDTDVQDGVAKARELHE